MSIFWHNSLQNSHFIENQVSKYRWHVTDSRMSKTLYIPYQLLTAKRIEEIHQNSRKKIPGMHLPKTQLWLNFKEILIFQTTVEPAYYEFLGTHEITTYYPHFVLGNEDLSVTLALPKGRSVSGDKCCRTLGWSLCQCLTQKQLPLQLLVYRYIIKKQSVQLLCLLFEKLVQKTV